MSASFEHECKDPAGHHLHVCQLRAEERKDEIAELMKDPGHSCRNCNAVTKNAVNLCNPSPFAKI